jgi:hypothetical protein
MKESIKKGWNDFLDQPPTINQQQHGEINATKIAVDSGTKQTVKSDNLFVDLLGKCLEDANLPGPDYHEFRVALKNMEGIDIPIEAKYKTAFATLSAQGLTVESLISTAQHYIRLLDSEKQKFEESSKKQTDSKVGVPESQISALKSLNADLIKQKADIDVEIEKNNVEIERIRGVISSSALKIETTRSNFSTTHQMFVERIQSDINNIQKILGGKK